MSKPQLALATILVIQALASLAVIVFATKILRGLRALELCPPHDVSSRRAKGGSSPTTAVAFREGPHLAAGGSAFTGLIRRRPFDDVQ